MRGWQPICSVLPATLAEEGEPGRRAQGERLLTERAARRIHAETGRACEVEIISQNGGPLLEPWRVSVTTLGEPERAEALMRDELARIPELTERFLTEPDWRP